jgi:hypothetical protein
MGTVGAVQDGNIDPPLIFAAPTIRSIPNSSRIFLSSFSVAVFDIR